MWDFDGEPWTALVEIALVGEYHGNSISLAELVPSLSLGRKMLYGCETLMESPEHAPRLIAIISKEQEITLLSTV